MPTTAHLKKLARGLHLQICPRYKAGKACKKYGVKLKDGETNS